MWKGCANVFYSGCYVCHRDMFHFLKFAPYDLDSIRYYRLLGIWAKCDGLRIPQ